jgi:zinc transport system substrate-binding protein
MMKFRDKITPWLTIAGLVSLGFSFFLFFLFSGCSSTPDPWDQVEGGELRVLTSFPPLYCFTKGVAGNDAKVLSLLALTGPHDHQANADDAHVASRANLFLVNGLGLDDFVTTVANRSRNKSVKVITVAEKALPEDKRLAIGKHDHGPGEHHHHGEWDPHAWLGIEQAILMVKEIATALKEADPNHAADYDKRAAEYVKKLDELHKWGRDLLKGKTNRKIIAMHESLGYFCKSFDLTLVGSIMPRPGVEVDGAELARLMKVCRDEQVHVIAVEPQYKPSAAETLKESLKKEDKDFKIALVQVDPLETAPRDQLNADYYFTVMRQNLKNLAEKMP